MKRGELLESIKRLIKRAGKKGITTEDLVTLTGANRQYIRKLIRERLSTNVRREGSASPTSSPTYRWVK